MTAKLKSFYTTDDIKVGCLIYSKLKMDVKIDEQMYIHCDGGPKAGCKFLGVVTDVTKDGFTVDVKERVG